MSFLSSGFFLSATETKLQDSPVPSAVPVVTPEEAEKLNDFAIFLTTVPVTIVEGEITERSELPDPEKSDYPNCRFTVHFNGNTIKSGEPCPKELSLIVEGFENYHILPYNNIKPGDKVLCTIFPFDQLPEDYQSTQQADDLELFLLESYYVLDIKTIRGFSDDELMPRSGIYFSDGNDEYISIFDRHINPPIPDELKKAQERSIQNDLKKMNLLLNDINDTKIKELNKQFAEVWEKEKLKDKSNYNRVTIDNKAFVWRNIDNSFWALPVEYTFLAKPDTLNETILDCFSSLKRVLEVNGVQFILSLVPDRHVISSRIMNKDFQSIPDIQAATYVKQLSERGVETIYASDSIINNYNLFPFAFFYPEDIHPADTTQDILSDLLVKRLMRYDIKADLNSNLFSVTQSSYVYAKQNEFVFPSNCDIGDHQEESPYTSLFRKILYNGEEITRTKKSPVMIIGNSFIEYPASPPDALPVLLSYKLSSPIDWYRISGEGPFSDILIQLLANPNFFLASKKVLIMQVGVASLRNVNRTERMLDIAKLDSERILLNNKKMIGHLFWMSNVSVDQINDPELWGPLSSTEKSVLKTDETGELTYRFKIEQAGNGINDSKPIVCIVPHTCVPKMSGKMTINEITKTMYTPSYTQNSRFFNLAYELPAGTKEITIIIEGKPGSLFAIKDIQIWQ